MTDPLPSSPRKSSALQRYGKPIAVAAALGLALYLGRAAGAYIPRFIAWVDSLGVWGPLAFIGGYAAATVAFVPGSLITLAAGAVFGLFEGVAYVFTGATLGALGAFLVARYGARRFVEKRLTAHERFAAVDDAVGKNGLKIMLLLRLSPVFPFNVLNYVSGLTRIRLRDYALACLGMIPGTFLYVYYGKLAGDVAVLASGKEPRGPEYYAFMAAGLAATVAVTAYVTRLARRALKQAVGE